MEKKNKTIKSEQWTTEGFSHTGKSLEIPNQTKYTLLDITQKCVMSNRVCEHVSESDWKFTFHHFYQRQYNKTGLPYFSLIFTLKPLKKARCNSVHQMFCSIFLTLPLGLCLRWEGKQPLRVEIGLKPEVWTITCVYLIIWNCNITYITENKDGTIFAGLTVAKKLFAMRWKHPDKLSVNSWILAFLDIIYLELSTARVIGVKESQYWFQGVSSWKIERADLAISPTFTFVYAGVPRGGGREWGFIFLFTPIRHIAIWQKTEKENNRKQGWTYFFWPYCGQETVCYEMETPRQALFEQLNSHISRCYLLGVNHCSYDWNRILVSGCLQLKNEKEQI